MTIVKAAAVQISPVFYSREGTVQGVLQKIADLAKLGVQFAGLFRKPSCRIIPIFPSCRPLSRSGPARSISDCSIRP